MTIPLILIWWWWAASPCILVILLPGWYKHSSTHIRDWMSSSTFTLFSSWSFFYTDGAETFWKGWYKDKAKKAPVITSPVSASATWEDGGLSVWCLQETWDITKSGQGRDGKTRKNSLTTGSRMKPFETFFKTILEFYWGSRWRIDVGLYIISQPDDLTFISRCLQVYSQTCWCSWRLEPHFYLMNVTGRIKVVSVFHVCCPLF